MSQENNFETDKNEKIEQKYLLENNDKKLNQTQGFQTLTKNVEDKLTSNYIF